MTRICVCLLPVWFAAASAWAQPAADMRVIATAKDWSITAHQFEQFLELLPDQQHRYFVSHRREFLDQLIRIWVMAAEARADGLDKTPNFKATVDFYSNNMLAGELHKEQVTGDFTASDEAVKTFYEANQQLFTNLRLSHIFIPHAPEARKRIEEAQAKLRLGANFGEVAQQYSQDTESAVKGGDLGYISKGQLPPELE